jgi:hypothetical protein
LGSAGKKYSPKEADQSDHFASLRRLNLFFNRSLQKLPVLVLPEISAMTKYRALLEGERLFIISNLWLVTNLHYFDRRGPKP